MMMEVVEAGGGYYYHVLVLSLGVRVQELDVPDAVHQAAPDPASLTWLLGGGVVVVVVQVLHLTVRWSGPAVKPRQSW